MTISVPASAQDPMRAVAFALGAATLLPIMDGLVKVLVQHYPVIVVAWARFALMSVLLGTSTFARLGWSMFWPVAMGVQCVRALAAVAATGLFYAGLQVLPLAESTAIMCLAPAIAAGAAHVWLGERATGWQWIGILASLGGAILIAGPGNELFTAAVLLPLAASSAFALFILTSRVAGRRDHPGITTFWTCFGGFLLFSLALPFNWQGVQVAHDWTLFVLIGVLGALGQFATASAYRHGSTALVAPLGYVSLAVAAVLGWLLFQDMLTPSSVAGMVLVGIGGVLVIRPSRRVAH